MKSNNKLQNKHKVIIPNPREKRINKFFQLFVVVFFLFLSSNCSPEEVNENKSQLNRDQMIALMADIHLAESTFQQYKGAVRDSIAHLYYQQILTIHGLSQESFQEEFEWWVNDADRSDDLYIGVLEYLDERNGAD